MGASVYNANYNVLTYAGYCALGGASNPNLLSRDVLDGRGNYLFTRYYLMA